MISELPPTDTANISAQPPMNLFNFSKKNKSKESVSKSGTSQKEVVRLVIISDTHGYHKRLTSSLPEGDILIHLGDFCNKGSTSDALGFANWVTTIAAIPSNQQHSPQHPLYKEIIVLEGNHDRTLFSGQIKGNKEPLDLNRLFKRVASDTDGKVQLLQDQMIQSTRYPQLKLYGASWNSCAGDNFPFQFDLMGQEPPDIMLAHVNPYISPSITYPQLESERRTHAWQGSEVLSKTVLENRIPLCMFGHVHWGRGVIHVPHNNQQNDNVSSSVFINAATLKSHRDGGVVNEPVVVDYDLQQRKPIRIHCPVLWLNENQEE